MVGAWDRLTRAPHRLVALSRYRWQAAAVAVLGGLAMFGAPSSVAQASPPPCPNGTTLNVVAHQDDDLLFMNPDVLHDIQSNRCVVTVYVTAGDAGESDPAYWQARETGAKAAHAQMAGVANEWTPSAVVIGSHSILALTLNGDPKVSLVFMRLPDGNYLYGTGYPTHNYESLQKLWQGVPSYSISAVDDPSSSHPYTKQNLIDTLAGLMTEFQPDLIRTQDSTVGFGNGDHTDHYASALFADAAQQEFSPSTPVKSYIDYAVSNYPQNVFGTDLANKQNAFYTYAAAGPDPHTCVSAATCLIRPERYWLMRSYLIGTPNANAGGDQTVLTLGSTVQLDGSASSDPNGDPITYSWAQTAGSPGVTLAGATTATPTFTAPAAATTLTFALTVSDGTLASTDRVTVTIAPRSTNIANLATVTASSQNTSTGQTAIKAVDGSAEGYPGDYTHEWATLNQRDGAWLNLAWASPKLIDRIVLYDRPGPNEQITSATLSFSGGSTFNVDVPSLANNGSAVAFSFPAVSTTFVHLAITSVSDSSVDIGLAEIEVWTPADQAPVANAGPDQTVNTGTAGVTLDGSSSSDPDNSDTLTYQWEQTGGIPVTLSSASAQKPSFTAPPSASSLTFKLTVSDSTLESTDSVTITVPDRAPVAYAGPDKTVNANTTGVTLDGSASADPDSGDTLTYLWQQTGGTPVTLSSVSAQKPSFTAPPSAGSLTFKLTVSDGTLESTDSVTITVPDRAPVANAGPDQTVSSGAKLTLDGSASADPDSGDTLSYLWEQTGGTPVALSSTSARKPTFTAPASSASLTFKLTVSDGKLSSSDSVLVTVLKSAGPAAKVYTRPQTKLGKVTILSAKHMAIFRFSGSLGKGKLGFQCKLDKGKYKSCRSAKSYKNLKHGKHVFRVRAKDAGGKVDLSPVTKGFKI